MNTKKLFYIFLGCLFSSAAFSLTVISFNADISLVAFPLTVLFLVFMFYFSGKKLFKDSNLVYIAVLREFLQYLPYVLLISFVFRRAGNNGTPYVLDFISVIFWLIASFLSLLLLHFLNPKYISKVSKDWAVYIEKQKEERKKSKNKSIVKTTVREILSWTDALVQAVFMVLLLNIFIVQLYEIPSESMVPEFLVKDRVVVFKTLSGPKFPLSNVGLPYLKKYDRGDIVVFRNPHYSNDRKSEVKTFISQLVYMCTLTKVNLNIDENGKQKADPLVKRVCGVEGEQLVMQDGILYARTKDSPDFKPVDLDSSWACWNLNSVKPSVKQGIQEFPLSDEIYTAMLVTEESRRNLDINKTAEECKEMASRFKENYKKLRISKKGKLAFNGDQMNALSFYYNSNYIAAMLLSAENGADWFNAFMTDWCDKDVDFAGDLYAEANYRLNLMIKVTAGNLILRNAELYLAGYTDDNFNKDSKRKSYEDNLADLVDYVSLLDQRNMPVFPANNSDGSPSYIPKNSYFMMGDNRFNSLDMRHEYKKWNTKLTSADNYSVTYDTNMAPQYVKRDRMLGSTSYRFWPLSRAGVPGKKK